ncbi:hypothetical protein [Streptomyces sp. SID3343]|uniref:hypothetical protein n=1 Tax=Streptomyces sp. SID3343 TaxID=2690260 RepID=UPI001371B297|nr:hypothetical protein [Streptomyces sp. SID3343]MYW04574.1 hypothetical protein [Streptomyces sp. SID3343]
MRIRRWFIYRAHRAVHIERGADPHCPDCRGEGGWWEGSAVHPEEPDVVTCPCNDGPRIRIPLGRRPRTSYSAEPPF